MLSPLHITIHKSVTRNESFCTNFYRPLNCIGRYDILITSFDLCTFYLHMACSVKYFRNNNIKCFIFIMCFIHSGLEWDALVEYPSKITLRRGQMALFTLGLSTELWKLLMISCWESLHGRGVMTVCVNKNSKIGYFIFLNIITKVLDNTNSSRLCQETQCLTTVYTRGNLFCGTVWRNH